MCKYGCNEESHPGRVCRQSQPQSIPVQPERMPVYAVLSIRRLRQLMKLAREESRKSYGKVVGKSTIVLYSDAIVSGANCGQIVSTNMRVNSENAEVL